MLTVRIAPEDGEDATVTMLEFSKRLTTDDFFTALGELITNRRARITLASGIPAEASLLTSADTDPPLYQAGLPLREYHGEATLLFELPGQIQVRASSDAEARRIITDVVRNQRRAPPGFAIGIDGDAFDTLNQRLMATAADGPMHRALPIQDVEVINLTERLMLDNRPPAQGAR